MLGLSLLSLAFHAHAGELASWSQNQFAAQTFMTEDENWVTGYAEDQWYGTPNGTEPYGEWMMSYTDDNVGDASGNLYGTGWAADNWLTHGPTAQQGYIRVIMRNWDDDTIGIVWANNRDDTTYLAAWSSDSTPPPLSGYTEPTLFLLRIEDGVAEVIDEVSTPDSVDITSANTTFALGTNDGTVEVYINDELVISYDDPNPLLSGYAGTYAYNCGYDGDPEATTNALFKNIEVFLFDDDDDGVADDEDNCEFDANEQQEDGDGDGIGDVCDPNPDEPDIHDSGDTDTDAFSEEQIRAHLCGCQSPSRLPALWTSLFGAAWLLRRRKQD